MNLKRPIPVQIDDLVELYSRQRLEDPAWLNDLSDQVFRFVQFHTAARWSRRPADDPDVESVASEVAVKLITRLKNGNRPPQSERLAAWLRKVANGCRIDLIRRLSKASWSLDELIDIPAADDTGQMPASEILDALETYQTSLPCDERFIMTAMFTRLPEAEIALRTGLSERTVSRRKQKIRTGARKYLEGLDD